MCSGKPTSGRLRIDHEVAAAAPCTCGKWDHDDEDPCPEHRAWLEANAALQRASEKSLDWWRLREGAVPVAGPESLEAEAIEACLRSVEARLAREHISCGLCGPAGRHWKGKGRCIGGEEHDRLVEKDELAYAEAVAALIAAGLIPDGV